MCLPVVAAAVSASLLTSAVLVVAMLRPCPSLTSRPATSLPFPDAPLAASFETPSAMPKAALLKEIASIVSAMTHESSPLYSLRFLGVCERDFRTC